MKRLSVLECNNFSNFSNLIGQMTMETENMIVMKCYGLTPQELLIIHNEKRPISSLRVNKQIRPISNNESLIWLLMDS